MVMVATTRIQNRYDHRLRELVHKTQDVNCAVQYGVPRSAARSWLATGLADRSLLIILSSNRRIP